MPNAYGQIAFTPTVIDVQTIWYADYRENRQFISLGNLHRNNRISIIAVDFAHQKRLKLLGRVETTEDPDVVKLLQGATDLMQSPELSIS